MSIEEQKAIADDVLEKLKFIDPTAIVAGGAPRDWYCGRFASDIDVFFYFRPDIPVGQIERLLKEAGIDVYRSSDGKHIDPLYKKNPDLRCIYYAKVDGVEVQLMSMFKPTFNVVDHFPLNICKVWYRRGKISRHPDFKFAIQNKAIVKVNELYAKGDTYVQKIVDKFKGFKYFDSKLEFVEWVYLNRQEEKK